MAKIAIVNKLSLVIENWYEANTPDQTMFGGPWGSPETHAHLQIPDEDYILSAVQAEMTEEKWTKENPEKWTKEGEEDLLEDPQDPSYTYVPASSEELFEDPKDSSYTYHPSVLALTENSSLATQARQASRDEKLEKLRLLRDEKLEKEVDVAINEVTLGLRSDVSEIAAYRQALLDFTETYKKVDGHAKAIIDNLDLENISWPTL